MALVGAGEKFPVGPGTSVFKVGGKVFAISRLAEEPLQVRLKVEPELAAQLRSDYAAIVPGYHLNKRHWAPITLGRDAEDGLVLGLVEDGYGLVAPRSRG